MNLRLVLSLAALCTSVACASSAVQVRNDPMTGETYRFVEQVPISHVDGGVSGTRSFFMGGDARLMLRDFRVYEQSSYTTFTVRYASDHGTGALIAGPESACEDGTLQMRTDDTLWTVPTATPMARTDVTTERTFGVATSGTNYRDASHRLDGEAFSALMSASRVLIQRCGLVYEVDPQHLLNIQGRGVPSSGGLEG